MFSNDETEGFAQQGFGAASNCEQHEQSMNHLLISSGVLNLLPGFGCWSLLSERAG
jgi:hypothetical protein